MKRVLYLISFSLLVSCASDVGEQSDSENIANSVQIAPEQVPVTLINNTQIAGATKFVEGKIVSADSTTGIPYHHTFTVESTNGDHLAFEYADSAEVHGLMRKYIGRQCTVDFIAIPDNQLAALIHLDEPNNDTMLVDTQLKNVYALPSVVGNLHAMKGEGGPKPIFLIMDGEEEFWASGSITEEVAKLSGESFRLHYRQVVSNQAMTISIQ